MSIALQGRTSATLGPQTAFLAMPGWFLLGAPPRVHLVPLVYTVARMLLRAAAVLRASCRRLLEVRCVKSVRAVILAARMRPFATSQKSALSSTRLLAQELMCLQYPNHVRSIATVMEAPPCLFLKKVSGLTASAGHQLELFFHVLGTLALEVRSIFLVAAGTARYMLIRVWP